MILADSPAIFRYSSMDGNTCAGRPRSVIKTGLFLAAFLARLVSGLNSRLDKVMGYMVFSFLCSNIATLPWRLQVFLPDFFDALPPSGCGDAARLEVRHIHNLDIFGALGLFRVGTSPPPSILLVFVSPPASYSMKYHP